MQNGASRPLFVLILWPQLSEKSICLYLALYFDLRSSRSVQFLNNFQIHIPPLVVIYALVSKSVSSQCQFHSYFQNCQTRRSQNVTLCGLCFSQCFSSLCHLLTLATGSLYGFCSILKLVNEFHSTTGKTEILVG